MLEIYRIEGEVLADTKTFYVQSTACVRVAVNLISGLERALTEAMVWDASRVA